MTFAERDIYLRHTGPDGKSYVQSHRVWDAEHFISRQKKAVAEVNAKEENPANRRAKVEQITDDQYKAERRIS